MAFFNSGLLRRRRKDEESFPEGCGEASEALLKGRKEDEATRGLVSAIDEKQGFY